MNIYFIIIMILEAMGLGMKFAIYGKERAVSSLISVIISVTLLYFAVKTGF